MEKGQKFEIPLVISEEIYNGFLQIFKDYNPLHTDSTHAKSKGFSDKVMHGNILNGLISYFVGECLPIKNVILLSQSIKYNKPIYLNDSILFKAEIVDIFSSVNLIEIKYSFYKKEHLVAKGTIQVGII
ncbi:MAG: hypothetical protein HQK52_01640 [Oligoflexia bacterium]|nr:hypothetical protein [Oligoflexia bacterium]